MKDIVLLKKKKFFKKVIMIRFIYPVEIVYIVKTNVEYSPYVMAGVLSGFVFTGFLVKKYILKLIRKNV